MGFTVKHIRSECRSGFLFPLSAMLLITIFRFGWKLGLIGALAFMLCLVAHECGHAAIAVIHGIRISAFGLCARGAYIRRERARAITELLISSAGPAVHLLIAGLLGRYDGLLGWLAHINLVLFLVNILPVHGSDGKRIFACIREIRARQLTSAD